MSSASGSDSDGPQSPRTRTVDSTEGNGATPQQSTSMGAEGVTGLLDLSVPATRCRHRDALVDYLKSILLTSE